jgi:hypothetical protein
MTVQNAPIHLYWMSTKDNDEDWFIFARSARMAAQFHEECHVYHPNDVIAYLVISNVLESVVSAVPCPADIAHLKALGFEIVNREPSHREVCLNGAPFVEGQLHAQAPAVCNVLFG